MLNSLAYFTYLLCNFWLKKNRITFCCVNDLKQRFVDLQSYVTDAAIEWRKRLRACMRADRQHFEHLL